MIRFVTASHRPHRFDYEDRADSAYRPSRADFEWLRNRMRSQIPPGSVNADTDRRIYVSRQRADRGRKLLNDREALQALRERGFESHVLEEYSFERQVRLFIEADVIAGPHGAGLANILFADDPLVVDLSPETVLKPHFYFLASITGFEYEAVVTDAVENNLRVDIDRLKQRLVVHYMQPHYPFVPAETTVDTGHLDTIQSPEDTAAGENVWSRKFTGDLTITRDSLWEYYTANLRYVLDHVEDLLAAVSGKAIVTSDHGNYVGERAFPVPIREYGHPRGLYDEPVIRVP